MQANDLRVAVLLTIQAALLGAFAQSSTALLVKTTQN